MVCRRRRHRFSDYARIRALLTAIGFIDMIAIVPSKSHE
jgi:hypothetical protein